MGIPDSELYGLRLASDQTDDGWNITATARFDIDVLRRAIEHVRDNCEYTVCVGSNRHVVHPVEWERGGLAVCAGCGTVVDLGPR